MTELDNLLGSKISLISQHDIRYEGILFSINAKESSIILRDVRCLGTEDRHASRVVAPSPQILAFVSFPGQEIKDLYVHESVIPEQPVVEVVNTPPPPTPAPAPTPKASSIETSIAPPMPPLIKQEQASVVAPQSKERIENGAGRGRGEFGNRGGRGGRGRESREYTPSGRGGEGIRGPESGRGRGRGNAGRGAVQPSVSDPPKETTQGWKSPPNSIKPPPTSSAGTGEHLLRMKERKVDKGIPGVDTGTEFDFQASITGYNKEVVVAELPAEMNDKIKVYKKDDFFDSLSSDNSDRLAGQRIGMSFHVERSLNQDTFGAIALQSTNYRRGRGGPGRGRGRGQYGGRGRGSGAVIA
jgi:protein LSM14